MCGLFGYLVKSKASPTAPALPAAAIELATYITQLRGVHSLGMAYSFLDTKENLLRIGHVKESESDSGNTRLAAGWTQTPHQKLTRGTSFDAILKEPTLKMLALHTRHATRGAKSKENSHPFREGNILLMHNGTLRNDYQINQKYFDVDSKALAYHLDQPGNSPATLVEKTNGAYALVWQDYRDGTLNLLRNDERPLFMAETAEYILWGSTKGVLAAVAAEAGLVIQKMEELPAHTYRQYSINYGILLREEKFAAPKFPVVAATGYYNRGGLGFDDEYDIYGTAKGVGSTTGNFPVSSTAKAGNNYGGNSSSQDTKQNSNVKAESFSPLSNGWFDHLMSFKGWENTSLYEIGRCSMLPSPFRRVEMGLKELRRLDKLPSPLIFRGSLAANAKSRHLISVFNAKIKTLYGSGGVNFVDLEMATFPFADTGKHNIKITIRESEYRKAMFFGLLVLAAPYGESVYDASTCIWTRAYANAEVARYFDPTIQGMRYLDEDDDLQDRLEKELDSDATTTMGTC